MIVSDKNSIRVAILLVVVSTLLVPFVGGCGDDGGVIAVGCVFSVLCRYSLNALRKRKHSRTHLVST